MNDNINIPDSNITASLTFRKLVLMNMQQLTNFPYIEKDFDALTDYELLCLVVKYLNDVIANQNEQNDSITNLYNAFLTLQTYVNNTKDTLEDAFNDLNDYVENYFDNLDVQDEIDNKLDEMLESGALEIIINKYFGDKINVKNYGAKGDSIADDTQAFKDAISDAEELNKVLYIPYGKYKITEPLDMSCNVESDNAELYYTGISNNDYLINFTTNEVNRTIINNIKLFCNNNINGISFNKNDKAVSRAKFHDIYVTNPQEIGILISTGGASYDNLFVNNNLQTYIVDGVTYKTLNDNCYTKTGIKINKQDNWINNTRCYGFGTGIAVNESATYISNTKMFVNYNGIVFEGLNGNTIYDNKITGQAQENYGQPLIVKNTSNSFFELTLDGNGVVDAASAINLETDHTAGYDRDGNIIACLTLENSFANYFNLVLNARTAYGAGRRQACERTMINVKDTNVSHHNIINLNNYLSANRLDCYPKMLNYDYIKNVLYNEITVNGKDYKDYFPYKMEILPITDVYTSSAITRTEKINGYNIQYTGSSTVGISFDIDISKSLGKNILWKVPISNCFKYNNVTITPNYSMNISGGTQALYQDTVSRSINNSNNGRETFLYGYISKETMEGLSNYTTDVSSITHVRVGLSFSFSGATSFDIDLGKPEVISST